MRDLYAAGQWAGFNKVLAILNTYDKKFVDKGMLYDDIMELRPVGAAEEFFKDDTRRPERLRPYDPDRVRVENGDWFRAGGDCICEKCGYTYYQHAPVTGYRWLHKLCNGDLVKL